MDWLALANTKAGAEVGRGVGDAISTTAKGLFGPDPQPMSGFSTLNTTGFLDGSGWTVATGSAKAAGSTRTGTSDMASALQSVRANTDQATGGTMQAGVSPLMGAALLGLLLMAMLKKRKGS